jgi:hypothetical protein
MAQNNSRTLTDKALLLKIRKKILTTEAVLKKSIGYQLLNQKNDVKQKKRLSLFANDEKKKRRKQSLLEKVRNKAAVKTGIFDGITNFFVYSLLGFVFTKIMPFLPKLAGVLGLLKPAGDFLALIARLFMGAIGGFIETGYKVHEQLKGKHEAIKKLPVKQEFDSFQKTLANTLSDVTDVVYKIAGQDSDNKTAQKPVKGAATGGTIGPTRGNVPVYKPPTREIKSTKQTRIPRKQNIPDTNIGKDVGGEAKVREFYRSPKIGLGGVLGIFRPKGNPAKKTPVDSISNISKTLRRRNQLFGDIASVGSDIALGQKPSKTVYRNTAKDVIELARFISEKQEQKQRETIFAMAYGGVIPNRATEVASRNNLVEMVSTIIERSVEERVNKAIGDFRQPIGRDEMLEKNREKAGSGGISGPDYGTSEGATGISGGVYGGYSPRGGLEKEIYEYLTKEKKLSDIQALGLMANISRESSFRPGIKERGGTGVGLFQWSHGRRAPFMRAVPDWETNWKAQIDYALNEPQSLSLVRPGSYASKTFASAQEAADWWMREWERPADKISGSRKHSSYLKGVPRGPKGSAMFRAPETSSAEVESKSRGFRTGLKTGPEGRIGAGTGYHVDARFVTGLSLKDKVAMMDSMASAHAAEGYVMEFSGRGVGDLRWNLNASQKEKEELAKRVLVSHHSTREGYEPFDYFIVKQNVKSRFVGGNDLSVSGIAGANIMAPRISGGSFEYQEQPGGYGRFLIIRDKNGNLVMKIGHGDLGLPSPRELGKKFNMDELQESVSGLVIKNGKEGLLINGKFKPKKWSKEEKNKFEADKSETRSNTKNSSTKPPAQNRRPTQRGAKAQPARAARPRPKAKPKPKPNALQNAFNSVRSGFRKLTGFKRGGIVGNLPNIPSGYTSYENYGGSVIVAIQPVMVQKEVMIDNHIPIPFPMSSGVNNLTNFRG